MIDFYKLWHTELTSEDQKKAPGDLIILNDLIYDKKLSRVWPYLQEYRIHFANIPIKQNYIGFISANINTKFHNEMNFLIEQRLQAQDYQNLDLSPIVISQKKWKNQAFNFHLGIDKYIHQYLQLANIPVTILEKEIVYCNSFITKKEIYLKTKEVFCQNVLQLFEDCNYELNFHGGAHDEIRKGGCLCERLWGLTLRHFSSTFSSSLTHIMWSNMVQ